MIERMPIPWNLNRTVAPTVACVSVDELKDHTVVTDAVDDNLLETFGWTAEDAIEKELSRALMTQTWVLRLDRFPCWEIPLPRPPLQSVTTVQYVDQDGATQTLSASVYTVDTFSTPGRLYPAYNQVWPSTRPTPNAVIITYVAGKTAIEDIPEPVRTAIKLLTGDLYENRERSASELVKALDMYERLVANHRCVYEFNYR